MIVINADTPLDFAQLFVHTQVDLRLDMPGIRGRLAPAGMLWVSWPKKASGVATDLHENIIREIGFANRLVDVKVAAVDETCSGLKFVIRLKERAPGPNRP